MALTTGGEYIEVTLMYRQTYEFRIYNLLENSWFNTNSIT